MRYLWLLGISGMMLAAPALAAGGGGGGGMPQMPSASAPQYDAAAEYRAGVAALETKDFKKAKTSFDHALSVASGDANTQYMAGVARTGLGDLKGARKFYAKAAKLDGNMVAAWRDLGVTEGQIGDTAKAQQTLAAIQTRRAVCAETCPQAADLKAAEAAVAAAMAGTPATVTGAPAAVTGTPLAAAATPSVMVGTPLAMVGTPLAMVGTPSAMTVPAGALLFASSAFGDGQYLAAVALINDRKYQQAIGALEAAQRAFGAHPDILTYLGFANRKLGRFAIAEGYYRAALTAAPGHRGATEYYGELMVERREMAGARRMLATLDAQCRFGCTEAEELRAWIAAGRSPHSL